jgi:F0F1-type ATP synthase assembly protein I
VGWEQKSRDFDESADEVARDFETRLRDELDLAMAREEALTQEKIDALEAPKVAEDPNAPPPPVPGVPVGPHEQGYRKVMGGLSLGASRTIGPGAGIAFAFIAYPLGGALLGYIIDRWFVIPQYGHSSWIPVLVCTLLGFYNGMIEILRQTRKLEADAKAINEERRNRTH